MKAMIMLLLLATLRSYSQCPPGANRAAALVTVYALDSKGAFYTGPIPYGDTAFIRAAVLHVESSEEEFASFYGGRILLNILGEMIDATPDGGIPLLGPADCVDTNGAALPTAAFSRLIPFVSRGDPIIIIADYVEGVAEGIGSVSARGVARFPSASGAIHISGAQLSFEGSPGRTYTIEGTETLLTWSTVGTVTADDHGRCVLQIDLDAPHRFYRFKFSPQAAKGQ